MRLIADADRVWMDAGPFFRFAEARKLNKLARYIGPAGCWVVDVANEIELRGFSPNQNLRTHPALQDLARLGFPRNQRGTSLRPEVNADVDVIRRNWANADDHPKKHRGEIATVLHAEDLGGELVLVDDSEGRRLADAKRVPWLGTTHLCAEMVVAGALDEGDGKAIYLSVGTSLTDANWARALGRYRSHMQR